MSATESSKINKPILYVVATPIGNLSDLSPRAQRALTSADFILAEDTRVAKKLLRAFGIERKELVSYYDQVETQKAPAIVTRIIDQRATAALISDAGTPCISDPGYRLVAEARSRGLTVSPIPGPSALTALVSVSGLPSHRVTFIGFLPAKNATLDHEIASWGHLSGSIVFFESLRRLQTSLKRIETKYPHADIVIGRELTKLHEEIWSGTITDALEWLATGMVLKGEVVVMIQPGARVSEGAAGEGLSVRDEIHAKAIQQFREGATLKDLLRSFKDCGISRGELYQLLLEAKNAAERNP